MDQEGYLPVPTFDYSSAFNYRSVLGEDFTGDEDHFEGASSKKMITAGDPVQQFAYYLLTLLAFLLFLLTAPVSSFFCVKKVNSLQRCLTYRLGNRLPLKGPGYILKLPFVDHISIIDLFEEHFNLVEEAETEVLTSDGSIIRLRGPSGRATLGVTNAVLTTLKLGKDVDVKQCLRLRFGNVLRSKHVEDLENKLDYVVKQFEENCNHFLRRWGYSLKVEEMPRFTVIERADPINPIKEKLSKLLNPEAAANAPSSPAEALLRMISPLMPDLAAAVQQMPGGSQQQEKEAPVLSKLEPKTVTTASPLSDSEMTRALPVLQSFLEQYKSYLKVYNCFNVQLTVADEEECKKRHCYFQYSDELSIRPLAIEPAAVHFTVHFSSYANFEHFLVSRDLQYLQYSFA